MKPYLAFLGARFRVLLQYRAAAIAGLGTQLFWGLIRMMIFQAFYDSSPASQPLSREEVVSYIWLGQAMLMLLPWSLDGDIRAMMRNGTVAYELLRPLDLYSVWYMRALAQRTAPTLLRCIPLLLIAGLFFGLKPPPSTDAGIAWVLTTAAAVVLACAIGTLMSVTLVSTVSGDGMVRFGQPLIYILSGMLIPLSLLPPWMLPFIDALPFRGLIDIPFRAYLGHIPLYQIGFSLAHQLGWALALVVTGRILLARSIRRMVIQGG